ncbi:MAG TPA: cell division protein ZapE [Bauldia sp.]|nr:cell division protein ZapE [Bauldia sp.]
MGKHPAESASGAVTARYRALVASGTVAEDPAQLAVAAKLDRLNQALGERRLASKRSALGWLFAAKRDEPVRGLYIHGPVGRGKTLLMDEFFAAAAPTRKRRTHFHAFMADVHARIHAARTAAGAGVGKAADDPIAPVAAGIARETRLLCLDEFAVEDIADAMILSRLFGKLFEAGLVLVATSNSAPEDLYRDGLNRALFLPFVAVLRRHVDVVELGGPVDYRLGKLGRVPVYVTPLGPAADAALDRIFLDLTGTARGRSATLPVGGGREIRVPQAEKGVARFPFDALCEAPLGAADYGRIADAYHTVIVDDVPALADDRRNAARRLINLVDTFYDRGIRLVVSAATEPDGLYTAATGREARAFERTVSRLTEMRTEAWLAAPRPVQGAAPDAAAG